MLRLLTHHSHIEIVYAYSRSQAERPISAVHRDLEGESTLNFSADWHTDVDAIVLCLGHGESRKFLEEHNIPKDIPLIDLTADFRRDGITPSLEGRSFVYGLPELNRNSIRMAKSIANPGCFATCIQLGLLPAVESGWIEGEVHVSAITGATGAGQKLSSTSHFPWRDNNISSYKVMTHQHLDEIYHHMDQLNPTFDQPIRFIPYRGNFSRGILATTYFKSERSIQEWAELYQARYALHPFTHVSAVEINLKQVVNTNKALVHVQKQGDQLIVSSCIDNLLKGASGQALQNLNLMLGLPEEAGLGLKASAF
jgi:N-acetyl-gamma-glutamyl-phosphate reductase